MRQGGQLVAYSKHERQGGPGFDIAQFIALVSRQGRLNKHNKPCRPNKPEHGGKYAGVSKPGEKGVYTGTLMG